MLESWVVPLGIVTVFAVLLLSPLLEALFSRVWRRRISCPRDGSGVSVEFVNRSAFGIVDAPDVRSCSAFPDPHNPTCHKECLRSLPGP